MSAFRDFKGVVRRFFGQHGFREVLSSIGERAIVFLIYLCGVSSIVFVFGIIFFVAREGYPFLRDCFDLKGMFFSAEWVPTSIANKRYGILALIFGTLSVTAVAMLIAIPFGLGSAIYLSQFCGGKTREALKILLELLAAVPSVVGGFVGLMVMNPLIVKMTGAPVGLNILNAGLVVGLMSVPVVVSISEDAIRAVPDGYVEAAEALGATRWQALYRVILPAAKSGLLAAALLGVGRAIGETMAVLMCTGHAVSIPFDGNFPYLHVLEPVRTLTATITAELGEAPRLDPLPDGSFLPESRHYQVLFVLGMVLFLLTFAVNLCADLMVRGRKKKA
jgi:phosphate transport system permease protein